MTVYDLRVQEIPLELEVLSENGLTLKLFISARYRPGHDTLGLLHQRIGANYVTKVVAPVVESAVRSTVGEYRADEVYSSQGPILYEINTRAANELSENFIRLDNILIKSVQLPAFIRRAVESKEEQRELLQSYSYRLRTEKEEALRKQIEAYGWSNANLVLSRSLTPSLLQWRGLQATEQLAASPNSKIVIVGNTADSLPVILGGETSSLPSSSARPSAPPAVRELAGPDLLAASLDQIQATFRAIWQANISTIGEVDSLSRPDLSDEN